MKKIALLIALLLPAFTLAQDNMSYHGNWFSQPHGRSVMSATNSDLGGTLGVMCVEGDVAIALVSTAPLFNAQGMAAGFDYPSSVVRFVIDGGAEQGVIGILESNDTFFMTTAAAGDSFYSILRGLQSGSSVEVRIILSTQRETRHHFSLAGSTAAISRVLNTCS